MTTIKGIALRGVLARGPNGVCALQEPVTGDQEQGPRILSRRTRIIFKYTYASWDTVGTITANYNPS